MTAVEHNAELTKAGSTDPRNFNVALHMAWASQIVGKNEDDIRPGGRGVKLRAESEPATCRSLLMMSVAIVTPSPLNS